MSNKRIIPVNKLTKNHMMEYFSNNAKMTEALQIILDNKLRVFTVKIKPLVNPLNNNKTYIFDSIIVQVNNHVISIQWSHKNNAYTYFKYDEANSAVYQGNVKRFHTILNRITKLDKGALSIDMVQKSFQYNHRITTINRVFY